MYSFGEWWYVFGVNAGRFKPDDDETYLARWVFLLIWDQPDFCSDTNRPKVCPGGNVRLFDLDGTRASFFIGIGDIYRTSSESGFPSTHYFM